MTIELLQTLSIVSYIVAGVLLLVAIALFFLLDVPKLFGDISGATARKAIESIRQQNESTGDKAYKPSPVNAERGKLTDKITQTGSIEPRVSGMGVAGSTERFDTADLTPQSLETTVLDSGSSETTVLGSNMETTVIGGVQNSGETTVLSPDQVMTNDTQESFGDNLNVDVEMGFSGSDEIIE